ncbi:Coenzyme PQQ synthesis protein E [bioreactor metagenome]|uniref:Coenzyme PQQ synthesis protein E n=1 Tax=bioreactor metagenome TaxID=1076179 RepID=A0A645BEB8_9ZZZZ|nr:radical SAM protein [Oscillospiraceae bacterium]
MTHITRRPVNATLELTVRCNLSCKMCLVRRSAEDISSSGTNELNADQWLSLAREMLNAGTLSLLITGGEPMLRSDFSKIYSGIASMGFITSLYTNATLLTPEICSVLEKHPPHKIGVTVYGASPETYGRVCGNSGAYEKMKNGVGFLKRLPSVMSLRTTIIKDNLCDLERIREFAVETAISAGKKIPFNISRFVTKPVRGAKADVDSVRLSPEENIKMLFGSAKELIQKLYMDNSEAAEKFIQREKCISEEDQEKLNSSETCMYGCSAGINSFTVSWDGKLYGCQLLSDVYTLPLESGFIKAWEELPEKVVCSSVPERCKKCELSQNCVACPATRLAETGMLDGCPEYTRQEAVYMKKLITDTLQKTKL